MFCYQARHRAGLSFSRGPGACVFTFCRKRRVIPTAKLEGPPDRPQGGDPSAEFKGGSSIYQQNGSFS